MKKIDESRPFNMIQDYGLLFEVMTTNKTPGLTKAQQAEGFAALLKVFGYMPTADQLQMVHAVRTGNGESFEQVVIKNTPPDGNVSTLPGVAPGSRM